MENKIYPFKFLDSYTAADKDFFFGREEEVKQLYQMIYQSDTLLLYGASGTGKTSLIQCGLASQFQKHDWLEVFVRRHNNINESLERALLEAGGKGAADTTQEEEAWLDNLMDDSPTAESSPTTSPIQHCLKNIYLQHFRPIYLIFDQFEELFILGDKAEQQQFIAAIREILAVEQPVKLIFSIREEYLGSLYELEKVVPELLRKKLRIDPMNLEKAKAVVLGATHSNKSIVNIEAEEADAIAEKVFEKIRGKENTLTIQLPYLQVFLDKFYRHVSKDNAPTPSTEATLTLQALGEIGDISNILRDFLDEQIIGIAQARQCDSKTIWKILSPFVTVDGTKEPTAISALQQQLPDIDKVLIEQVVWDLMDKRILRYLEEVDLYEVAHDSLALRIAEKRSDEEINLLEIKDLIKNQSLIKQEARELFSEKQLEFIEPFLTRIQLNEQEQALIDASKLQLAKDRQRARHLKWFGISTTALVFMIISAFAAYSKMEKDRAEQANTKNERIVNAMDFYDDKYALAFNNGKYGFIDKEGHPNPHIKFEYDKGEPFNVETGLAQMEINENGYYQEYLLDTLGHRHKVIKVASFFNTSGASNSIFSSAELDWLERRLPKGKQQKNILKTITALEKNNTLAQQKLMEALGNDAENLALDFAGIPTENIITIIKNIVENPSIKDRVEILLFKNTHLKQLPASVVAFKNLKWLDCSATPITSLPNALNQLEHLIHLELNNSALRVFPSVIGQLINLNYLSIAGSFDTIPSSIGNLHLLNCLRISGTFDSLPASIGNLQQLQHLHIESNLQHLPVALGQLQRLNKLAIRGVFKEVPTSIGQLQQLKSLHLNGLFTAIPTTISRLQQLNSLNLQGEFEEIPSSIGQLQQLSYLELQGNFSTLPEEIGQLQALKELYILGALQTVPTAIGELGQLQTLVMEGQFRSLPESIGALQNLQELSVFGQLESIPGAIGALPNLKKLDIVGLFSRLPNSIGELQNLTELFVFGKLETLPSSIGELTKLKILKIEGELDTIPSTIGQLQNLKELTVFGQLPQFPQAIRQLSEIKELRISGQFDTIPESIGKFWKLNHLVLKGRFSAVPAGFDQLSRIKYLELISPNLEQLPDLYAFKNLHQFKCTLAKNASYENNKTMLQTFFKKHPYCKHSFVDEQLNPVVLTK